MSKRAARAVCPLCGNDRIVRVTRFVGGNVEERRAVCVGSLGCDGWFDADTLEPVRKGWDDLSAPMPIDRLRRDAG
jgi:hypothetical protein